MATDTPIKKSNLTASSLPAIPGIALKNTMASEVPIAILKGKLNSSTSSGTYKNPPPTPRIPKANPAASAIGIILKYAFLSSTRLEAILLSLIPSLLFLFRKNNIIAKTTAKR